MALMRDAMTHVASSPVFLLLHVLWFAMWIGANAGIGGVEPFDPYPFGLLTLLLSMEAIVLTIFVLMSQGREAGVAELREELTLQVNLRIEEEVTKTLQLVTGLYARLGFSVGEDAELRGMLRPLDAHEIALGEAAGRARVKVAERAAGKAAPKIMEAFEKLQSALMKSATEQRLLPAA